MPRFKLIILAGIALLILSIFPVFGIAQGDNQDNFESILHRAEQGDKNAQFKLTEMYSTGTGGPPLNQLQAYVWLKKASRSGHPKAMAFEALAILSDENTISGTEAREAAKLLLASANQGEVVAQFTLGTLFRDGIGVPKNCNKAVMWFEKAARQDYHSAFFALAQMYGGSYDCPLDPVKTFMWFDIGAIRGDEGHPECVDSKGEPFKGRNCAGKVNIQYRYMEADMYNLVPAVGEINALRSNYSFAMIPGEATQFGTCEMKIEDRKAEPPPGVRGDIARTCFYMDWAYPGHGVISGKNRKLFEAWDRQDPVDAWECERAKRIEAGQGNENPAVKGPCIEAGLW